MASSNISVGTVVAVAVAIQQSGLNQQLPHSQTPISHGHTAAPSNSSVGLNLSLSSLSHQTSLQLPSQVYTSAPSPSGSQISGNISTDSIIGRPKVDVNIHEIKVLRGLNFSWTKIADIMNISRATLYRKLEEAGINTDDHSQISDHDLDNLIIEIKHDHPNDGEVLMQGHLVQKGLKITRERLRKSIHRVDHENTVTRLSSVVKHRVYSVAAPNCIWHVDGNHKLIKWRFIVHAGVDGFSRVLTYIQCSTNNQAVTAFRAFSDGVATFGVPDKVRTDHGGENIEIWRYMVTFHGNGTDSVLTGSSVHNERVERLWRDVHRCVLKKFSDIFFDLESEGYLDPLNEVDLFCLHYVFLPRINRNLVEFRESWNHHKLSTEGNCTPFQLFFEGMLYKSNDQFSSGIPRDTSVSLLVDSNIEIPTNKFVPCQVLQSSLSSISILQNFPDCGKTLFISTVQLIGNHLLGGCNHCPN